MLSIKDIEKLQFLYIDFLLSKSYNTIFWQFIHSINNELCSDRVGYLWSNIWKIGKKSGKGRADCIVNKSEETFFNICKDELQILKPDFIVFLSGPDYDKDIENHFGRFTILENYLRCFDRLSITGINATCFRIYHPNYLRQSRLEAAYRKKLCSLIKGL